MLKYLITYFGMALGFATLDAIYLVVAGQRVYRPTLDYALADKIAAGPAVAFYLMYILGVLMLAVLPNRELGFGRTALTGAMLGAMAYATYDLTNQATLKVWATRITLIDICWGTFLTCVGASVGYICWQWSSRRFG